MGMAASQARYLALTARKSNVEFQGQQINQQRTNLAVQQSELFSQLMGLKNPLAPSILDYEYDVYTFDAKLVNDADITSFRVRTDSITTDESTGISTMNAEWTKNSVDYSCEIKGKFSGADETAFKHLEITDGGGQIETGDVDKLSKGKWTDQEAYDDAYSKWTQEQNEYNAEVEKINKKTEQIQLQDRTLELKLRNLDTEQQAIQTELESVKKVIEDTVKNVFKTFQSS